MNKSYGDTNEQLTHEQALLTNHSSVTEREIAEEWRWFLSSNLVIIIIIIIIIIKQTFCSGIKSEDC